VNIQLDWIGSSKIAPCPTLSAAAYTQSGKPAIDRSRMPQKYARAGHKTKAYQYRIKKVKKRAGF